MANHSRKFLKIIPVDEEGSFLGPRISGKFGIEGKDLRLVGPLFDNKNGEYIQAFDFKKGAKPTIRIVRAGVKGDEIPLAEIPVAVEKPVRILEYGLAALLVLSLAVIGILWRRIRMKG